jgi:5-methylcytosine-specific restriction endonuclease McrA
MNAEEFTQAEADQAIENYIASLHRVSLIMDSLQNQVRTKPLLGGCFGHGGFVLMSHWTFGSGLDVVNYFVADAATRFVVGWGDSKQEALSFARGLLTNVINPARLSRECAKHAAACLEVREERAKKQREARETRDAEYRAGQVDKVKSIPRRRKQIFDAAGGKCHYCQTTLTLDGKWHIEHKMPKALGGDNQPGNLVASCVSCNHKKRDTTDVEFKARLAKEASA